MRQQKRLSKEQFNNLVGFFASNINASKASKMTLLNQNTINKYYKLFYETVYHIKRKSYLTNTFCETKSYFGYGRYRSNNSKLQSPKNIIVFGIIERNDQVYIETVSNIKTKNFDTS